MKVQVATRFIRLMKEWIWLCWLTKTSLAFKCGPKPEFIEFLEESKCYKIFGGTTKRRLVQNIETALLTGLPVCLMASSPSKIPIFDYIWIPRLAKKSSTAVSMFCGVRRFRTWIYLPGRTDFWPEIYRSRRWCWKRGRSTSWTCRTWKRDT